MPTLPANGISLFYELHGPDDGDVLVLNNGILMTAASSWGLQTPALARRYRLLLYDYRRVQHSGARLPGKAMTLQDAKARLAGSWEYES